MVIVLLATAVPDIVGVLSYVGEVTFTTGTGTVEITKALGSLGLLVFESTVVVAVMICVAIVNSDPGVNDQFPTTPLVPLVPPVPVVVVPIEVSSS